MKDGDALSVPVFHCVPLYSVLPPPLGGRDAGILYEASVEVGVISKARLCGDLFQREGSNLQHSSGLPQPEEPKILTRRRTVARLESGEDVVFGKVAQIKRD